MKYKNAIKQKSKNALCKSKTKLQYKIEVKISYVQGKQKATKLKI